jgi:Golgi phosphoprotein 3
MLTMLEEVVLLAVDESSGCLRASREWGAAYALVGALFFDLALAGRIDTDTDSISIVNREPTGNAILDRMLALMAEKPHIASVRQWIETFFDRRQDLEGEALQSLISQGILRHEKTKLLWIIDVERFPLVNNRPQQHVKLRLAQAILGDEIPDTRDIMLVSLAEACGLLGCVLSEGQLQARRPRIQTLCGLETISRKVTAAIADLETNVRQAMTRVV